MGSHNTKHEMKQKEAKNEGMVENLHRVLALKKRVAGEGEAEGI